MREVLRKYCTSDSALIVYARPGSQDLSFEDLEAELSALIERVRA